MANLDDIVCYESGSNEQAWSIPFDFVGGDYDTIMGFCKRKLLCVEHLDHQLRIKGTDCVGLLLLPSGRRIVIKSKVPNIVILQWLQFIGWLPDLEHWETDPSIIHGESFHDCLGRLFIHELDQLTRRFLRKDFVPVQYSSSTLRGKILAGRLGQAMHRLPNVPQLARIRKFDVPYNAVLALALDKVPLLLLRQEAINHHDMARLRDEWSHVSREVTDVISAVVHAQWACPFGYRNALQLAKFILLGAVVDHTSGMGGEVFTLSLSGIWERGLRKVFRDLQARTGWKMRRRRHYWADASKEENNSRRMQADVHVKRDGIHWILDTKYKRDFGAESRTDRFQMCAYALGFGAQRATLVYPTGLGTSVNARVLLDAKIGECNVRIDSIDLPMAEGPEACKETILSLCAVDGSFAFI